MRNSGGGYVSTESSKDYIALPSSAGTVWVDLSEFEENHGDSVFAAAGLDGQGRERHSQSSFRSRETPENSFMRRTVVDPTTHGVGTLLARMGVTRRRGSATTHGDPADHNSRQPTIEHGKRFFGGSRRTREGSGMSVGTDDPGSQSTLEGEGHGKDAVEEEALALELLRFRLPHKQGAEEAKSSATRAAKMCEAYVAQEMQVRQMWRIGMGNAPGLKVRFAAAAAAAAVIGMPFCRLQPLLRARSSEPRGLPRGLISGAPPHLLLLGTSSSPLPPPPLPAHTHAHTHTHTRTRTHTRPLTACRLHPSPLARAGRDCQIARHRARQARSPRV